MEFGDAARDGSRTARPRRGRCIRKRTLFSLPGKEGRRRSLPADEQQDHGGGCSFWRTDEIRRPLHIRHPIGRRQQGSARLLPSHFPAAHELPHKQRANRAPEERDFLHNHVPAAIRPLPRFFCAKTAATRLFSKFQRRGGGKRPSCD